MDIKFRAVVTIFFLVTMFSFQNCGEPFVLKSMSLNSNGSQSNNCLENPAADECTTQNLRPLNCDSNENETCFFKFEPFVPLQEENHFLILDGVQNKIFVFDRETSETTEQGDILPPGPFKIDIRDFVVNRSYTKAYLLVEESNQKQPSNSYQSFIEIDLSNFEARTITRNLFDYDSPSVLQNLVYNLEVSSDEEKILVISRDRVTFNGQLVEVDIETGEPTIVYTDPSVFADPGFGNHFAFRQFTPTENASEYIIFGEERTYDDVEMTSSSEHIVLRVNTDTGSREELARSLPGLMDSTRYLKSKLFYRTNENSIYYGSGERIWKLDLSNLSLEQIYLQEGYDVNTNRWSSLRIWEDQSSGLIYGTVADQYKDKAWLIDYNSFETSPLIESRIGSGPKFEPYLEINFIDFPPEKDFFYLLNEHEILKVNRLDGSREVIVNITNSTPLGFLALTSISVNKDGTKAYLVSYNQIVLEVDLVSKEVIIVSSWSEQRPEVEKGSGPSLFAPYSGKLSPDEDYLYLTDQNDGSLYRIDIETGNREVVYNQEAYTPLLDYRSTIVSIQPERSRVIFKTYNDTSQLFVELDLTSEALSVVRSFDLTVKNYYDGQVSLYSQSKDYFHIETDEGIVAIDLKSDELQIVPGAPIGPVYGFDSQRSAVKEYSSEFIQGLLIAF